MSMESFLYRAYHGEEAAMDGTIQESLNYYARQIKALLDTFPDMDAPLYLAAVKSVHDVTRNMLPGNGPETEDELLGGITTIAVPVRRQK